MADFDLDEQINNYPKPNMFKAGLRFYIEQNKIKIKNKKDLDKIVKEYGELKL